MSDRERDPYQVLGIGADASGADIARAYRRLARALHPDSRPGDPAAAQFRALSDAYGLLSDPARRAAYDHQHPPRPARRPRPPGSAGPPLWPLTPAAPPRPARPPARGAPLRAGPVSVQPSLSPGVEEQEMAAGDPALAYLLCWLLAPGREWPW
ncbi:MAG: J domain-containing protein [Streptosporangiaceae bacterium]